MATETLTPEIIRAILDTHFPGVRPSETDRLGGVTFVACVWQFEIEVSLTIEGVSPTDKNGEVWFQFSYHPPEGPKAMTSSHVVIRQREAHGREELDQMIGWSVRYLSGIVAAIETAFEAPLPRKTSIFDER